ncbi:hypothetical protein NE237_005404 [Protea cynaroides]|uniref:Uncharacterized protein n=1 Tax=Protea cynaroides TaxID=273540 RepID=A0A9Q0KKU0_9MAGN|nr:hypothetical protein NE237_005404 [Protea cynaroides]
MLRAEPIPVANMGTNGDLRSNFDHVFPQSGKDVGQWADADNENDNLFDEVKVNADEGVDGREVQVPVSDLVGEIGNVTVSEDMVNQYAMQDMSYAGGVDRSAQQRLPLVQVGVDLLNQGVESSGRTTSSSPSGNLTVGENGCMEVTFLDVEFVDRALLNADEAL